MNQKIQKVKKVTQKMTITRSKMKAIQRSKVKAIHVKALTLKEVSTMEATPVTLTQSPHRPMKTSTSTTTMG